MNNFHTIVLLSIFVCCSTSLVYASSDNEVKITSTGDIKDVSTSANTAVMMGYFASSENAYNVTEVDLLLYNTDMTMYNVALSNFDVNDRHNNLSQLTMYAGENYTEYVYSVSPEIQISKSLRPLSAHLELYTNLMPDVKIPMQLKIHYKSGNGLMQTASSDMNYLNAMTSQQVDAENIKWQQMQQQQESVKNQKQESQLNDMFAYFVVIMMAIIITAGVLSIVYMAKKIRESKK